MRTPGVGVAHVAAVVAALLALGACGTPGDESGLSGPVVVDGSSTVEPLSSAAAELYMGEHPGVNVTVGTSGTGGGFKKFCAAETDISNASRPIKPQEAELCRRNNVAFTEMHVANDALTVVVDKDNTWAECLTVSQLNKIWEPNSKVTTWNQVDPRFAEEPLALFGPGSDSGTFDYFTEVINGREGAGRTDYNPSEDDNITVQGVANAKGAMGYFGYPYFEENTDKLKALRVDAGNGCVAPSPQTAQDGSYKPLSRPLFIYASDAGVKKPQVAGFTEFYLQHNQRIVEAARFIPLTEQQKRESQAELHQLKAKAGG